MVSINDRWLRGMGLRGKFTLLFYSVTVFSLGVVGYYGYTSAADALLAKSQEAMANQTAQVSNKISDFLELTRNDLDFFSSNDNLVRHLYWQDMDDDRELHQWKGLTLSNWLDFIRKYDYIHKVRFIDTLGQERITIRRDPETRQVWAVPENELQDRSSDDYFVEGMSLEKDSYAITPMDLNRENGIIEKPLQPVVRLVKPVFGENKVKYGVVVINLFADAFFKYIRSANLRMESGTFYLIDGDGSFLFHPDVTKSFDDILGHGESFKTSFPGVLPILQDLEQGTLFAGGNAIGFKRVFFHPNSRDHYWILVGVVDQNVVLAGLNNFKLIFSGLMGVILALVLLVSRFYVAGLMRPLLFVTRQMQQLGDGRVEKEDIVYNARDEIRQMLDSTQRLLANMEFLANQADTIAQGDFSQEVQLLSDQDRLGSAINNMTAMLRAGRQATEQQSWLKDGIGQLSRELTGNITVQELAERAIAFMGRYLAVGRGALFVYDPQQESLEMLGSYMFTQRAHLANRFLLGEGAVGQVAREKKPIVLTIQEPGHTAPVTTGTASVTPLCIYTWPLLREGELLGVVELSGFHSLDALRQEFLNNATQVVSSFLFMATQRQRIQVLLEAAETATHQAQEHAKQLVETNRLMALQQNKLQQQTEELQQTNAQMEEQQQQLQQQSEELQQTNAQMEEQQQQLRQQSLDLQDKNEALILSKQELDQRAKKLEESNRYKSEFLSNMSHELRTPLNSIIVLSKMLSTNQGMRLDGEGAKQARVIHDAGNELLRLINDILDLSKIEAGKVDLHWETFAVSELAGELRDLFESTAQEKGLVFAVDVQYQGSLTTDRHKLSQVVRNLLSNAFKFTRQGRVDVTIRQDPDHGGTLLLEVRDTGIGVPKDKQQVIFEEFRQGDGTTSREFGGTGLGLSICNRLLGLLGGEIRLDSMAGQGSLFTIRLPLHGVVTPPSPLVNGFEDDRKTLVKGESPILIIDDDPTFCKTVILLNRQLGYKTIAAMNGAEGLKLAQSYHPAGIILDLGLPDRDGLEILNQLKATRELNAIPVYIITGKEKMVRWQERGAMGLLQKPVSAQALSQVMAGFEQSHHPGRLLMVAGEALGPEQGAAFAGAGVELVWVENPEQAESALAAGDPPFRVVVTDFRLKDGSLCTDLCARLRRVRPEVAFVVYSSTVLSDEEELAVRDYTDSIIQQVPQAEARLLANVERFLREVRNPATTPATGGEEHSQPALAGRLILVVDDDPRNLFVTTAALERHGALVKHAMNGKNALTVLAQEKVDLVLMDIMMPEMSGYQAIKAIRADPRWSALPIIALTAKAMKEDRAKCLQVGANDYLAKPVDYDVLVNMVRAWSEPQP